MTGGPPPEGVRAAYGLSGEPVPLTGGFRGGVWRVGDAGLKPLDLPVDSLQWHADLLERLDGRDDFRVTPLLRTRDGQLTTGGWLAWRFEPGDPGVGQWDRVLAAGRAFHAAVAREPRPGFVDDRVDWWAVGDRTAWGEATGPDLTAVPLLDRIRPLLQPLDERAQLIHGDLTENVLLHHSLPALVIDLSMYWRPTLFADAIVVVDALTWRGAPVSLVTDHPEIDTQFLLRALVYRLVTHHLGSSARWLAHDLVRYERALDVIVASNQTLSVRNTRITSSGTPRVAHTERRGAGR